MKGFLVAAGAMCAVLAVSSPTAAAIVEVSTSIAIPESATDEDVKVALRAAAREALSDIGDSLKPVLMAVTSAYTRAGRLYIRFVIADEAGAHLLSGWGGRPDKGDSGASGWDRRDRRLHELSI